MEPKTQEEEIRDLFFKKRELKRKLESLEKELLEKTALGYLAVVLQTSSQHQQFSHMMPISARERSVASISYGGLRQLLIEIAADVLIDDHDKIRVITAIWGVSDLPDISVAIHRFEQSAEVGKRLMSDIYSVCAFKEKARAETWAQGVIDAQKRKSA